MIKKIICILIIILMCSYLCIHHFEKLFEKNFFNYNTILSEKVSINASEKYKALKFKRNINSTTRISYHLSIVEGRKGYINEVGNIYISYQDFEYDWKNNNLIIKIHKDDDIFKQINSYKDIIIKYEIAD